MANTISPGGALYVCRRRELQGRDGEAFSILDRLYSLVPHATASTEIHDMVLELSSTDRRKLYFAMQRACIAAGRVFNLEEDPNYLPHNFENIGFPAEIKQQAIVQFAFEEDFIDYNYANFNKNFNNRIKERVEEEAKRISTEQKLGIFDQVKAALR